MRCRVLHLRRAAVRAHAAKSLPKPFFDRGMPYWVRGKTPPTGCGLGIASIAAASASEHRNVNILAAVRALNANAAASICIVIAVLRPEPHHLAATAHRLQREFEY